MKVLRLRIEAEIPVMADALAMANQIQTIDDIASEVEKHLGGYQGATFARRITGPFAPRKPKAAPVAARPAQPEPPAIVVIHQSGGIQTTEQLPPLGPEVPADPGPVPDIVRRT